MSYPQPLPATAHPLRPQSWPFDADLLPPTAHLVGGSVRDALLHRQADYLDLDFVLPAQAIETASRIAKCYRAGFVVLDAQNQIARAVFDQATIDFAQQVGPTLETDLRRRDFTINAIAYHPSTDRLIDPLGGIADLKQQTLRMVCHENLAEDPLRLLRAYRQAAQLGFRIDDTTRATIRELAPLLKTMAAERVRHELDALISKPTGTRCLQMAYQDGLLADWLPHLSAVHFSHLTAIDKALNAFAPYADYWQHLHSWPQTVPPGHYRSWVKIAKLSQLLPADEATAETCLAQLKYSRNETQAVLKVLQAQPSIDLLLKATPTREQLFFFFKSVGLSFAAVSLVAAAQGCSFETLLPLVKRYQTPSDPLAHPKPLLTGRELMQQLTLKPGPEIGQLLAAIEQQQAKGTLTSAAAALEWAKAWQTSRASTDQKP
ncbi:MAG: CCA tRNA nucleotidyltransferase [Cyanobacteria bacterium J06648_16]